MKTSISIPDPVLDARELEKIDLLKAEYEMYYEPGRLKLVFDRIGDNVDQLIPSVVKDGVESIRLGLSEAEILQQALKIVAKGFSEIESRAASLTVNKDTVVKRIQRENNEVTSFEHICLARGYEIERVLNLKDIEDLLYTAIQGGVTGAFGFSGIPFNIVVSTFLYFRAVQNIALYYGYDVKNDAGELEIASSITMQAFNSSIETNTETLSSMIGKMMLMTKATALRQGLNKSYADMINKGGVQLFYVQIRALANNAAKKALDKAGKKGMEKTVFSEMFEQLGKHLAKSSGKKAIPVASGIIGALFDTAFMNRVLKYAKVVYHKRYLLEKEQRIEQLMRETKGPILNE